MDASDMGLPDDELYKGITELAKEGFDFDDLLKLNRCTASKTSSEIGSVLDKHERGPFRSMARPRLVTLDEDTIGDVVDSQLESDCIGEKSLLSLAIKLTDAARQLDSQSAHSKVCELLEAMKDAAGQDLNVRLTADVCLRELQ